MKVKHIVAVFIIGAIFIMSGALFKIQHWPGAKKILLAGLILEILGLILLVWWVLTTDKFQDTLDA